MYELNGTLELIDLTLHHLLSACCEVLKRKLNPSTFHNLFSFFDGSLLSLFGDFPKFIGQNIHSLMQLILRLVVLPHVWVLVRKVVEFLNESIQHLLLAIQTLQVFQELALHVVEELLDILSLYSLLAEGFHHLLLVCHACLSPKLHQDSLEIIVDVASIMDKVLCSKCRSVSG
jgi:hypothetical protein